jgi:hypothetical protein
MYSFAPRMRILNGFLQAVTGLHDLAVLSGSRRAQRLFRRGERAARATVRVFDTGAWSLYSARGPESSLGYHQLVRGFLHNLCRRTHRWAYCGAARRFGRYLRQPPRIAVAPLRDVRAGRGRTIAFWLSKVSRVTVVVVRRAGRAGRAGVVMRTNLDLARGGHSLRWTPFRAGRYEVVVTAVGLSGPRAQRRVSVRVAPRRHHHKRHRTDRRATIALHRAQGG